MSELFITPNFEKKTAKIHGVVAAGEHVSVVLNNCAELSTENLRLRVLDCKNTVAVFPLEENDSFTVSENNLTCTLNLNTENLLKAMENALEREFLFVLDNPSDSVRTLHAEEFHSVLKWRMIEGNDTPVNLDDYQTIIEELNDRVDEVENKVLENKQDVENALSDVASLSNLVSTIQNRVATVEINTTVNTNSITETRDDLLVHINEVDGDISDLNSSVRDVENQLSEFESKANGDIGDLKDSVSSIEDELGDFATKDDLATKADSSHQHLQYAKLADMGDILATKADKTHEHENYATKTELEGKADVNHSHDDYALRNHDHGSLYPTKNEADQYAVNAINSYAAYALSIFYTKQNIDNILSGYDTHNESASFVAGTFKVLLSTIDGFTQGGDGNPQLDMDYIISQLPRYTGEVVQ